MRETTSVTGSGLSRSVVFLLAYGLVGVFATALVVVAAVGAAVLGVAVAMSDAAIMPLRARLRRASMRRRRMSPARRLAATLVPAALLLAVAVAAADVAGPDDTPAQAYGPMQAGTTYSGTFRSSDDVDHLSFKVDRAGQTLHFVVNDTVQSCASEFPIECAVWGTLVDAAGNQLGGEGSTAGTGEVDPGTNDVIDWTFSQPGTYYLALDSGGMGPSYTARYDVVSPPSPPPAASPTAAPTAPALAVLTVRSPQHGLVVRARATFGRAVRSATAKLVAYRRTSSGLVPVSYGRLVLDNLPAGSRSLRVPLNRTGRRALARTGRLRLRLRLTTVPQSGAGTATSLQLTLSR